MSQLWQDSTLLWSLMGDKEREDWEQDFLIFSGEDASLCVLPLWIFRPFTVLKLASHWQCPTGTRYPTRTRSFFQYPIRTRFVFKIIGYFGYRVFHKTMFLTWKMPLRSYKILTNIILYHLYLTKLDCHYFNVLWANCNGNLLHNYIIPVFPWVLYIYGKLYPSPNWNKIINNGGIAPEFMGTTYLQGFKERCDQRIKILNIKVYF